MAESEHYSRNGFLTKRGYAELAQRTSLEGLLPHGGVDTDEDQLYLDKVGSVSALVEVEGLYAFVPDQLIDEQYRRFCGSP
jgi:hypothetical protein